MHVARVEVLYPAACNVYQVRCRCLSASLRKMSFTCTWETALLPNRLYTSYSRSKGRLVRRFDLPEDKDDRGAPHHSKDSVSTCDKHSSRTGLRHCCLPLSATQDLGRSALLSSGVASASVEKLKVISAMTFGESESVFMVTTRAMMECLDVGGALERSTGRFLSCSAYLYEAPSQLANKHKFHKPLGP